MKPLRLLLGGSPCTNWSIAQSKNREVAPSGVGWELFQNYVIAKAKFQPDHFIYENNKSAAKPIKAQIHVELKGTQQEINSALVSAQNRQRFYEHSGGVIPDPVDRGILLKDILESGQPWREKAYCLTANYSKTNDKSGLIAVPVRIGTVESGSSGKHDSKPFRVYSPDGKSVTLCGSGGGLGVSTGIYATPVRVCTMGLNSQGNRIYDINAKSLAITANSGGMGGNTGLYAEPVCHSARMVGRRLDERGKRADHDSGIDHFQRIEINQDPQKTNALTTVQKDNLVIQLADGTTKPVYEVKDGHISIKGERYKIKLPDGFYIIRKLTVKECCRLQTMPDDYFLRPDGSKIVSDTQAYRGLGNGWTAEVIIYLLEHMLRDVPRDYPLLVLSMYDGIGTGRYCLDKMGFSNVTYYAYEIDKYAMAVASANYPDIIQMGDAFQVREPGWELEGIRQATIEDFLALATGE